MNALSRMLLSTAACMASACAGVELARDLDGAIGHVFKVDVNERCFELLKETEYDPKTDLGQSRFVVHWDADTRVVLVEELTGFEGVEGPVMALFQGIREPSRKALAAGRAFEARTVTLYQDANLAAGMQADGNQALGLFSPTGEAQERRGDLMRNGKSVAVKLRGNHWKIWLRRSLSPADLASGFWKTTVQGKVVDGRFVIREMEVFRLPDPRVTDDPKLPRLLVIGDSISMNYQEAATQALAGVVNYHRNEGNAFASKQGVRNMDLWLGNHQEEGFQWDVIQFNHGLHDLKQAYDKESGIFGEYAVSLGEYQANLEKEIEILKQTGAQLIWCSTTPVPNDNKGTYARRKGSAKEFNATALMVMRRHPEIVINDLHQLVDSSQAFDQWRTGADVHFYREHERKLLGDAVASAVRQALENASDRQKNIPSVKP